MAYDGWGSDEVAQFWQYIAGSVDRLAALLDELPASVVRYRPSVSGANSVLSLCRHTFGNTTENILGVMCGQTVERARAREFGDDVEPAEVLDQWRAHRVQLEQALRPIPGGALDERVEHPRRGVIAKREVLIIVARHAAEHLGQAELTRDIAIAAQA